MSKLFECVELSIYTLACKGWEIFLKCIYEGLIVCINYGQDVVCLIVICSIALWYSILHI